MQPENINIKNEDFTCFCDLNIPPWTSVKGEDKPHIILNPLFPEQVTRSCTHLLEGGFLILRFCTFYGLGHFQMRITQPKLFICLNAIF